MKQELTRLSPLFNRKRGGKTPNQWINNTINQFLRTELNKKMNLQQLLYDESVSITLQNNGNWVV